MVTMAAGSGTGAEWPELKESPPAPLKAAKRTAGKAATFWLFVPVTGISGSSAIGVVGVPTGIWAANSWDSGMVTVRSRRASFAPVTVGMSLACNALDPAVNALPQLAFKIGIPLEIGRA